MPASTALYTVREIREIEQASLAALPAGTLMQRAGKAAAQFVLDLLASTPDARVLAVAGPGNNGGDALEAARLLAEYGLDVSVLLCADASRLPRDAGNALKRARSSPVNFMDATSSSIKDAGCWNFVLDGLFGIGLARPIEGDLRKVVEAINALPCPVIALDVPSGLDADTGGIVGDKGIAVLATHTITFIGDKPGLHTLFGRDCAGDVHVATLDIDARPFKPARIRLNSVESFSAFLRPRPHNSHKGSYGDVIVAGGARGMAGAPILAARAAAKCGAGRVFAAFVDEAPAYDGMHPELMCRSVSTMDFSSGTIVAGPGMGASPDAHAALEKILHGKRPLVLDADALNLIASRPPLQNILAARDAPAIMTPHPLEAARLLQSATKEVQADRLQAARALAARFHAVVILKGSGSIVANPQGEAAINPTGNPGLATAGTGDVLAGLCGALLAQEFPSWNAALAATWLHGRAADVLAGDGIGPIGLAASELIPVVRTLLNRLTGQHAVRKQVAVP